MDADRGRAPTRTALAVAAAVVAVAALGATVGAHGTHATVRPQVVADGRVVVDSVAVNRAGFLAIHRDDGGEPGAIVGHSDLLEGVYEDVTVGLDEELPGGTTELWAVVHADDGDGRFDPATDEPVRAFGGVAASSFVAEPGDRPAYVVALDTEAQGANETVAVAETALAEAGHVVLWTDDRGDLGEPVGSRSLSAGVHRNVRVPVDPGVYPERGGFVRLWAVVHADDGDGEFEQGVDPPVTVGDRRVRTGFTVREVPAAEVDRSTATPTSTPVRTPTATTADGDGRTATDGGPVGGGGSGFGVVLAVLALALALAAAAGRRR
jgi:hypothetical protein